MNSKEKAELLKDTIFQLYVKENRTKSYIGKLLGINRSTITKKITEWGFPEPEQKSYLTPSNQKFINKHKQYIISCLKKDIPLTEIAKSLKVGKEKLLYLSDKVPEIKLAKEQYLNRIHTNAELRKQNMMQQSRRTYDIMPIVGEEWMEIKEYPGYEVSNMGQVRKYAERYNNYYLLTPYPNKNSQRLYVSIQGEKVKNFQVARLVGHAFVEGYSETNNTINHINGDVTDNRASNLQWMSQADNNLHAYQKLNRAATYGNQYKNKYSGYKFIYKNKYEFKTVTALAKFINKSETQTRRYLKSPEQHNLKIKKITK